jgi:hypothetical protein
MRKYYLGDHPEITISSPKSAKFFGAGGKFDLPNLEEKIKEVARRNDQIIAIGEKGAQRLITAPSRILDQIQNILKSNIGISLNQIENLEAPE